MKCVRFFALCAGLVTLASCGGSKSETASAPAVASGTTESMVRTNAPSACVVDVIGTTSSPKADAEIDVSAAGPLTVAGWAAHVGGELPSGVEIAIDQKMYPATYGLPRNDVAAALNNPAYNASGFTFSIPASQLSSGAHTLAVRVINKARTGYFETPTYHIRIQ